MAELKRTRIESEDAGSSEWEAAIARYEAHRAAQAGARRYARVEQVALEDGRRISVGIDEVEGALAEAVTLPTASPCRLSEVLAALCESGMDVHCSARQWRGREDETVRETYTAHVWRRVQAHAHAVHKNNELLRAKRAAGAEALPEKKDQGFTRPSALILLPLKNVAFEVVTQLIKLSGLGEIHHEKRFREEFGPDEEDGDDSSSSDDDNDDKKDGSSGKRQRKPRDFRHLFRGNTDDHFRMGIKVSRKSLKLYSNFESSDIIVASPLGLKTILDNPKENGDFLSSIQWLVLDMCDVFLMQNPQHAPSIMAQCNAVPQSTKHSDFARVRDYFLDGKSRHFRQTLAFCAVESPEVKTWMLRHACNAAGSVAVEAAPPADGVLCDVAPASRHSFQLFKAASLGDADEARFRYFVKHVVPRLESPAEYAGSPTVLFVPSYYDFVRVRNFLKREREAAVPFAAISEYTSAADTSRIRTSFFHGKVSLLLLTERAHFFRRYRIRTPRHVVFYALPQYPWAYAEVANFLEAGGDAAREAGERTVWTLVAQHDAARLKHFVGAKRALKIREQGLTQFNID